ncbi:MAG TPA: Holliday junction branch migration protein RuvA, partial [Terriglobales bacterium]
LELRDKLQDFGAAPVAAPASPVEEDVLSALVNLGYQRPAAERALAKVANGNRWSFEALFRETLAALSK